MHSVLAFARVANIPFFSWPPSFSTYVTFGALLDCLSSSFPVFSDSIRFGIPPGDFRTDDEAQGSFYLGVAEVFPFGEVSVFPFIFSGVPFPPAVTPRFSD